MRKARKRKFGLNQLGVNRAPTIDRLNYEVAINLLPSKVQGFDVIITKSLKVDLNVEKSIFLLTNCVAVSLD